MRSGSTVFVDTNVLLYAQDGRVPAKQHSDQAWLAHCWTHRCGRLSTQVLNEFYVNLRKAAPGLSVESARELVRRYRAWQPWTVDEQTVERAWGLQDRFSLSYWDALMVAAAQQLGCIVLLSEDLQHGLVVDRLEIVNPFFTGPDLLHAPE